MLAPDSLLAGSLQLLACKSFDPDRRSVFLPRIDYCRKSQHCGAAERDCPGMSAHIANLRCKR